MILIILASYGTEDWLTYIIMLFWDWRNWSLVFLMFKPNMTEYVWDVHVGRRQGYYFTRVRISQMKSSLSFIPSLWVLIEIFVVCKVCDRHSRAKDKSYQDVCHHGMFDSYQCFKDYESHWCNIVPMEIHILIFRNNITTLCHKNEWKDILA